MNDEKMNNARKRSEKRIMELVNFLSENQASELDAVFEKTLAAVEGDARQVAKLLSVQCAAQMVLIGELNCKIDDMKGY